MGKPVAWEASAEDRDTRGFISMTTRRPSSGFTANWMFEPPVSTPISRMILTAASRISWYSLSVSVCAGATVTESPVCTPMGSTFSIEQMMTTLSARSRMTSSSNSFQPITDSSISTVPSGDICRQQRLRSLARDDARHELRGEGLDVRSRGHLGIGHDRRRIAIDEDDFVAFLAQRSASLRARVIELAGLADDDRPRADDHDLPQIGPLRHPLLFHEPVDDRGVRRCFLALVEHVVDAAGPDPDRLTVAPQLLAQHAHAALDALLDGVRLHRGLALRRER